MKERKKFYNERWMQKPGVMEKRKLTAERYNRRPENLKRHAGWLRRRKFFLKGEPVGVFDPKKIMSHRLLKALDEVRKGDKSLPSKRRSPYDFYT